MESMYKRVFLRGIEETKTLPTIKGKCPFKFHASLDDFEERICLEVSSVITISYFISRS